jgi:hypothetical protein
MSEKLSVYITTYNNDRNAWLNHQEKILRQFYLLSDKKYNLADCPEDADLILVVDVWEDVWADGYNSWLDNVSKHPLIKKYPGKSFSISDIDSPIVLHHGIYASGQKGYFSRQRVRTGSYSLFFENLKNSFIDEFDYDGAQNVEKEYLFSFMGRNSHHVRSKIFQLQFERKDIYVEDTTNFNFFSKETDNREKQQKHFYDILLKSKFSLCPLGSGANSLRLFESMQLGVAPVIISDRWIYPRGVQWKDFSIIIKEKHIKHLETIIESHEASYDQMGHLARRSFQANFAKETYFNYLVENCLHIQRSQWIPEQVFQLLNPVYILGMKAKNKIRFRSRVKQVFK